MVNRPAADDRRTWDPGGSDDHFADQADQWNDKYHERASFQARLKFVGETILCTLGDTNDARVLDFGSGTGLFAAIASQKAAIVISIDRSVPMLTAGREGSAQMLDSLARAGLQPSIGRVLRVAGDAEAAGGLRCHFDLISAVAVVEYVDDCSRVLTQLGSVLAPGGKILMTVPNPRSPLRWGARAAQPALRRIRPADSRLKGQSYLLIRPHGDRPPWRHAARMAGLTVEGTHRVPLATSGPASLIHPNLLIQLGKR